MRISKIVIASSFAIGIAVGVVFVTHGPDLISTSIAQETGKGELLISPTEARERNFYAPNSETLMPDEMRVIACGTGMPTPRPAQAAACFNTHRISRQNFYRAFAR